METTDLPKWEYAQVRTGVQEDRDMRGHIDMVRRALGESGNVRGLNHEGHGTVDMFPSKIVRHEVLDLLRVRAGLSVSSKGPVGVLDPVAVAQLADQYFVPTTKVAALARVHNPKLAGGEGTSITAINGFHELPRVYSQHSMVEGDHTYRVRHCPPEALDGNILGLLSVGTPAPDLAEVAFVVHMPEMDLSAEELHQLISQGDEGLWFFYGLPMDRASNGSSFHLKRGDGKNVAFERWPLAPERVQDRIIMGSSFQDQRMQFGRQRGEMDHLRGEWKILAVRPKSVIHATR